MSRSLNMAGAYTCAIAQAQGRERWLTQKAHSYHISGHVNVWVCGYCFRSTRGVLNADGTVNVTPFVCACGAQLP